MQFQAHQVSPQQSNWVEAIFHYKNFVPDHSIERVVPTGHAFLIFELDGITRHTYYNETLEPKQAFEESWISGIHRNHISISAHQDSEMFVIQFKPFGLYPYLHRSTSEIAEQVLPAKEVFGASVTEFRDQLLDVEDVDQKFEVAEKWLDQRCDSEMTPNDDLIKIVAELQQAPVDRFNEIVANYPRSQKHLIDQFKKFVGITPKYFQRINRFNEILLRIHQKEKIEWTDITYSCGFSDQSHFIKEFKHFSGFNPGEFLRQDYHNDQPNFFPLDREG